MTKDQAAVLVSRLTGETVGASGITYLLRLGLLGDDPGRLLSAFQVFRLALAVTLSARGLRYDAIAEAFRDVEALRGLVERGTNGDQWELVVTRHGLAVVQPGKAMESLHAEAAADFVVVVPAGELARAVRVSTAPK